MAVRLVPEHSATYFPSSVSQLGQYVTQRPHLIAFLGSLMAVIRPQDPPVRQLRACAKTLKVFPRVPRDEGLTVVRILHSVYRDKDPKARAKVLEYIVYQIGPFSTFRPYSRDYACSIRDGNRRLVHRSKKFTLDAAFLGSEWFEGHECKLNPQNYLHETGVPPALSEHAESKLGYLRDLRVLLLEQYHLKASVCLTGLYFNPEIVRQTLARHAFCSIEVKGPIDIEKAARSKLDQPSALATGGQSRRPGAENPSECG